jgi:hypothetical protein
MIANLFPRLIELLGKEVDHPDARQFVKELGEEPVIVSGVYVFKKCGFSIAQEQHIFLAVFFWFGNEGTGFLGTFPGDIKIGDHLAEVRKKLENYPKSSRVVIDKKSGAPMSHVEEYDLGTCLLNCQYDENSLVTSIHASANKDVQEKVFR